MRLKSKVLFLDIKGGTTLDSLNNMKCDISKYLIYDLKNEGFPFPIFNLSSFDGKNAKVTYILNVIGAAVELTNNQYNDLAVQVESMICENQSNFSLADLFQKLQKNKNIKLKNKLQPLLSIMNSYTPKGGKYKYSSCREFIEDSSKITILSINQDSIPALHSTVYTLLQSLFEHQVINSSKHLVVYADEMQKYTADSPFKQMYAEAREFRMCNIAMTQEYRAPGNDIKEISSNAAMEIFYIPTNDSEKRVFGKLGKNYSVEEHHQKGVGYIWAKGYFWSKTANGHKYATLKGMNDDSRSSEQQSHPKNKFQLKGRLSRNRRSQSI